MWVSLFQQVLLIPTAPPYVTSQDAENWLYGMHKKCSYKMTREGGCFAASISTDRHQGCAVGDHYGRSVEHNQMPVLELA